jgi:hypothetical protein
MQQNRQWRFGMGTFDPEAPFFAFRAGIVLPEVQLWL